MKTITYNAANEIRIVMMIAIFTTAIFTTIKVRELQVNDMNNSEMMRPVPTEVMHNSFPVLPVADAKLIEEPSNATGTVFNSNQEKELAVQMKTWMNNNTYWSDEATANKEELTLQLKTWIKNGTYFTRENVEEPTSTAGVNPVSIDIVRSETADNQANEIVSQLESWMNGGDYWSKSAE